MLRRDERDEEEEWESKGPQSYGPSVDLYRKREERSEREREKERERKKEREREKERERGKKRERREKRMKYKAEGVSQFKMTLC